MRKASPEEHRDSKAALKNPFDFLWSKEDFIQENRHLQH
jgi:hypothetical protein